MNLYRSLRRFASQHDELPAFHAGFLVLSVLVAFLLNLGAFAVVIFLHMLLDAVYFHDGQGLSWSRTVRAVIRENLPDIALLLTGLTVAVLLHENAGIVALGAGIIRSGLEVLRAIFLILPKLSVLRHLRATMQNVSQHLRESRRMAERPWGTVELGWAFLSASAAVVLALAPFFFPLHMKGVPMILANQLIPWRL